MTPPRPPAPTTASLLTPPGRGAVATVAVRGPEAIRRVAEIFQPASGGHLAEQAVDRVRFGRWGHEGEEVVVARISEHEAHVHCHGGHAAASAILGSLAALGCATTSWQAWLNAAERDPIAAAARVALADATTETAAAILLDQHQGALRRAVDAVSASLSAGDPAAVESLATLLGRASVGLRLASGWKIVLTGQPNVGKSRLLNALLGYDRAIVFDQPGTTRDVLSARAALGGWPIELCDSAGLRATRNALESAGVERARRTLDSADFVLVVCDATQPWSETERELLAAFPEALVVVNKRDLLDSRLDNGLADSRLTRLLAAAGAGERTAIVSAATGDGLDALASKIVHGIAGAAPLAGAATPFTPEQASDLREAHRLAIRGEMAAAGAILAQRSAWRMR